jgi:hypothetical protein
MSDEDATITAVSIAYNCTLDDVQDYDIDFLKQPVAAAAITEFFRDRIRELPLI